MAVPALTSIDAKVIKRGKWYGQLWIRGTNLPPIPVPLTVMRATHVKSGQYADFTTYMIWGPERLYIWGRVPKHAPRGLYNVSYVTNDVAISTITNAFLVKG